MSGIDNIPAEVRWAMATRAMTGALTATNAAVQAEVSDEQGKHMTAAVWGPAGAASGELADALGLPRPVSLAGFWDVAETLIHLTMGPEFKATVTRRSLDRMVVRVDSCPWASRAREQGVEGKNCAAGDHAWCVGLAEYYGLRIQHEIASSLSEGDECCTATYRLVG